MNKIIFCFTSLLFYLPTFTFASIGTLKEGYYGSNARAQQIGSVNDYEFYSQGRYCGYKLSWLDSKKTNLSLELGMNPVNGELCAQETAFFICDKSHCMGGNGHTLIPNSSGGFIIKIRSESLSNDFITSNDPQTFLFPKTQKFRFKDYNFGTMDELCAHAKSKVENKVLHACEQNGYTQCELVFSEVTYNRRVLGAQCEYSATAKGSNE